jgi:hypothetical protein
LEGEEFGAFRSGLRGAIPFQDGLCHYLAPRAMVATSRDQEIPIFLSSLE